jgi:hypothetical protein
MRNKKQKKKQQFIQNTSFVTQIVYKIVNF